VSWNRRRTPKGTIGTTNQTLRWTMGVIGPRVNPVMRHSFSDNAGSKLFRRHRSKSSQINLHVDSSLSSQRQDENRVETLTFTAKCWQYALRDDNTLSARYYDEMSIIHFLNVARKEFHFVRWNCWFQTIRATIAYWFAAKIASLRRR